MIDFRLEFLPLKLKILKFEADSTRTVLEALQRDSKFFSLTKTPEEVSVVVDQDAEIDGGCVAEDRDWDAFRVVGVLDFGLVGVLSTILSALASADVSVFAVSTYNTYYVLFRPEKRPQVEKALSKWLKTV